MINKKPPQKSGDDSFQEHYLVRKIVGSSDAGNVVTLSGYLGKSENVDAIRLYTNIEFNEYFEINKTDILHKEDISEQFIEFGGTRIWIDGNSDIKRVYMEVTRQQAKFLKGRISQKYVRKMRQRRIRGDVPGQGVYIRGDGVTEPINCTELDPACGYTQEGVPCTPHSDPELCVTLHPCYTMDWPNGGMNC